MPCGLTCTPLSPGTCGFATGRSCRSGETGWPPGQGSRWVDGVLHGGRLQEQPKIHRQNSRVHGCYRWDQCNVADTPEIQGRHWWEAHRGWLRGWMADRSSPGIKARPSDIQSARKTSQSGTSWTLTGTTWESFAWSDLRVNNKSGYVKLVLKVCTIPSQTELVIGSLRTWDLRGARSPIPLAPRGMPCWHPPIGPRTSRGQGSARYPLQRASLLALRPKLCSCSSLWRSQ